MEHHFTDSLLYRAECLAELERERLIEKDQSRIKEERERQLRALQELHEHAAEHDDSERHEGELRDTPFSYPSDSCDSWARTDMLMYHERCLAELEHERMIEQDQRLLEARRMEEDAELAEALEIKAYEHYQEVLSSTPHFIIRDELEDVDLAPAGYGLDDDDDDRSSNLRSRRLPLRRRMQLEGNAKHDGDGIPVADNTPQ